MRHLLFGVVLGIFVAGSIAPTTAAPQPVTGRLVDAACYHLNNANTGPDHRMPEGQETLCASKCVKMGLPVGLLASDGGLYLVTGALAADGNAKLLPHMGDTVALTGDVTRAAGTVLIAATELRVVTK
jgi:hypothetical protein